MMEGSDPAAILREIQSLARASHVPVRLVTQRQIQQAQGSEAPQGVIAFAEPLTEADLSDLVRPGSAGAQGAPSDADGDGSPPRVPTWGRRRGVVGRRARGRVRGCRPRGGGRRDRRREDGVSRGCRRRHRPAEPRRPPAQRRVRGCDGSRAAPPSQRPRDAHGHEGRRWRRSSMSRSPWSRACPGLSRSWRASVSGHSVSTSGALSRSSASSSETGRSLLSSAQREEDSRRSRVNDATRSHESRSTAPSTRSMCRRRALSRCSRLLGNVRLRPPSGSRRGAGARPGAGSSFGWWATAGGSRATRSRSP